MLNKNTIIKYNKMIKVKIILEALLGSQNK